ncbi:MAG: hypothetical protein ISP72_08270 [Flavobacteriaceae bacterium]|nr:hypothetical protein [Flavobacteriaceae bacterium]|tara:strand:+ start:3134 stop:3334 length:201 start_codon:yes stop_codon:yes gene_type:complete
MAVEIKELIVKGFVNGNAKMEQKDIIKLVQDIVKKKPNQISNAERERIIQDCLYEFKNYIDHKLNY